MTRMKSPPPGRRRRAKRAPQTIEAHGRRRHSAQMGMRRSRLTGLVLEQRFKLSRRRCRGRPCRRPPREIASESLRNRPPRRNSKWPDEQFVALYRLEPSNAGRGGHGVNREGREADGAAGRIALVRKPGEIMPTALSCRANSLSAPPAREAKASSAVKVFHSACSRGPRTVSPAASIMVARD